MSAIDPDSGTTRNFPNPVRYRVSADNGSTRDYTVIVRYALSHAKAINSFTIGNVAGVIDEDVITVTVPDGTDLTRLSPVVLFTGSAVNPASGTAQDFTDPVSYRVSADDGSTRDYTVTVQLAAYQPSITIAFTPLASETIDLSRNSQNDLSLAQNDTLQIHVNGNTPPVRWFINGAEQDETGVELIIAAGDYPRGIHRITALI